MDVIIEEYPMFYKPEKYEIFDDDNEFQNQCCFSNDEFFYISENNEVNFDFFPRIKEVIKYPTDTIKKIKKSNSISPKFQSHCFFNAKLKNYERININNKKKQKKPIYFISRKKNRKGMKDNIIKKIKSRFFKSIKKILKEKLFKTYKYNKSFQYLPQKFISNIKKENNKSFWEETLYEFFQGKLKSDNKALKLLNENKIGEIKLKDLFYDYLNSREFEESIPNISNERNVDQQYIDDYIYYSKEFINYFNDKKDNK